MSLNFNGNYIGGVPSGGGGGTPYILPVASTTTLGGVKIDGTSITIDDGVISSVGGGSITVDSALSDSSENPVQNKVINTALNGKQATIDANNKLSVSLVDGGLNTDASNLTSTGQKVFDGAWVSHLKIIADGETAPTTNIEYDLSEELPDDSYNYTVQMNIWANSGSTTGNRVRLSLRGGVVATQFYSISVRNIDSTVQSGMISVAVPVSTARKLTVLAYSDNIGTFGLNMIGYRRIGTNA